MVTVTTGRAAETAVAQYLEKLGYKILDRNWKTKICEIDIVAQKSKITYFVEVKYRVRAAQGSGFEYITERKQNQLKFAARVWNQNNKWEGDYRIVGAEVTGLDYEDISLVDI